MFYIIGYAIGGVLDNLLGYIAAHPTHSIYLTVFPTHYFPWELFNRFAVSLSLGFKIYWIGGVISFIIASIIAGLMGGAIGKSFGGWILTVIFSILLVILAISLDDFNLNYISFSATLMDGIITSVIAGAVNGLVFGVIVIIIALLKGKS